MADDDKCIVPLVEDGMLMCSRYCPSYQPDHSMSDINGVPYNCAITGRRTQALCEPGVRLKLARLEEIEARGATLIEQAAEHSAQFGKVWNTIEAGGTDYSKALAEHRTWAAAHPTVLESPVVGSIEHAVRYVLEGSHTEIDTPTYSRNESVALMLRERADEEAGNG